MPKFLYFLLMLCFPLLANSQTREVDRTWLFGMGGNALYDAYLSPLDYHGPTVSLTMLNERTARWGKGNVSSFAMMDINGSYAENPDGNANFSDATITISMGWHYNWHLNEHWRFRAGGLGEVFGGGTYSSRNGNNPAQARLGMDIAASGIGEYNFFVRHHTWSIRAEIDIPLFGGMFSPQYGQSYYEAFELNQYDHNICATWPGNRPDVRFLATLSIPVRKAHLLLGYKADIHQSNVNSLERHAWNNAFVIGFTRQLHF